MTLESQDVLENDYAVNLKKISELQETNIKIVLELIKIFHHVKIGDTVLHVNKNRKVVVERFGSVSVWQTYYRTNKPWIYGRIIRKDGLSGKSQTCIYNEWCVLE